MLSLLRYVHIPFHMSAQSCPKLRKQTRIFKSFQKTSKNFIKPFLKKKITDFGGQMQILKKMWGMLGFSTSERTWYAVISKKCHEEAERIHLV